MSLPCYLGFTSSTPARPGTFFHGRVFEVDGELRYNLLGVLQSHQHECLAPADGSSLAYDLLVIESNSPKPRELLCRDVDKHGGNLCTLMSSKKSPTEPFIYFDPSESLMGREASSLALKLFPDIVKQMLGGSCEIGVSAEDDAPLLVDERLEPLLLVKGTIRIELGPQARGLWQTQTVRKNSEEIDVEGPLQGRAHEWLLNRSFKDNRFVVSAIDTREIHVTNAVAGAGGGDEQKVTSERSLYKTKDGWFDARRKE
jgi:hypothetical protein